MEIVSETTNKVMDSIFYRVLDVARNNLVGIMTFLFEKKINSDSNRFDYCNPNRKIYECFDGGYYIAYYAGCVIWSSQKVRRF